MAKQQESNQWQRNHLWEDEINLLKGIADEAGLTETVKWGGIVYTYNGKNIVGIGGFKEYFTLWFFKGVFLRDEAGMLVNANEENTKSLRQWRFSSKEDINRNLVLQYILEAVEVEKAGLEIKPEKKQTVIPVLLQDSLDKNNELAAAFQQLTPYKQREYCEHIESAKREETKLLRLEKCLEGILKGKGLHDKYR
ncbi:YdeI/OmpD-associated family protein [Flavobacterium sp.]|uniref:YdeI/OmpD-associated family protein n=1 Tax=Flavobacterium sp. TaxID=239 RepID=UPI002625A4A2|nr:YdeI/OmpD-associated family protein [Flavobacterium sp.]